MSPIEKIFKEIFGYAPEKSGTAFERLASIASYIIQEGEVFHDEKLRGHFSNTLYQLDIYGESKDTSIMGEAKDYSLQSKKVGRGDLQKLGGALPDLKDIDAGVFYSATEYTSPAKKYAESAEEILGKPITLWQLRPGTELDEEGFVKTVVVKIHVNMPQPEKGRWLPHFTENGMSAVKALAKRGEERINYQLGLSHFYDSYGNEALSLHDLTLEGYGGIDSDTGKSHGCFILKNHYIKISGILAEIHGMEFEVPYEKYTEELRITDDSGHRFVLVDKNGKVSRFLTDKNLREFDFDENGRVVRK
ncbi:restriction endonuclease [Salinicola avicenniae]|uniref:restriction endonuclease n=1 Tax=Salinicola avicenniae TaxID=2916836 RepID=UPI002072FFAE|nr:restriction endonuclease [Salinicola sp. S1-1-8]